MDVETDAGDTPAVQETASVALLTFAAHGAVYAAGAAGAGCGFGQRRGRVWVDDKAEVIADERLIVALAAVPGHGNDSGGLVSAIVRTIDDLPEGDTVVERPGLHRRGGDGPRGGLQLILAQPRMAEGDDDAEGVDDGHGDPIHPPASAAVTAVVLRWRLVLLVCYVHRDPGVQESSITGAYLPAPAA